MKKLWLTLLAFGYVYVAITFILDMPRIIRNPGAECRLVIVGLQENCDVPQRARMDRPQ